MNMAPKVEPESGDLNMQKKEPISKEKKCAHSALCC